MPIHNSDKFVMKIYEAAFDPSLWRIIFLNNDNQVPLNVVDTKSRVSLEDIFRRLGVSEHILAQLPPGNIFIDADIEVASSTGQAFDFSKFSSHIQRSLQFFIRIQGMKQYTCELEALMNLDDRAVIILDERKRIKYANRYSEILFHRGLINRNQDCLYFSTANNKKFDTCISLSGLTREQHRPDQDSFLIYDADNDSYAVRVRKITTENSSSYLPQDWVVTILPFSNLVTVADDEISRFCSLFGITDAEEKAVAAIVKSIPLHTVAENSNKKGDTVRKQLKSAMNKAHVSSQKQLIQLIERFSYTAV